MIGRWRNRQSHDPDVPGRENAANTLPEPFARAGSCTFGSHSVSASVRWFPFGRRSSMLICTDPLAEHIHREVRSPSHCPRSFRDGARGIELTGLERLYSRTIPGRATQRTAASKGSTNLTDASVRTELCGAGSIPGRDVSVREDAGRARPGGGLTCRSHRPLGRAREPRRQSVAGAPTRIVGSLSGHAAGPAGSARLCGYRLRASRPVFSAYDRR